MSIDEMKIMAETLTAEINAINDEIAKLERQRALKISDRTRLSSLYSTISVGINSYEKAIEAVVNSNR